MSKKRRKIVIPKLTEEQKREKEERFQKLMKTYEPLLRKMREEIRRSENVDRRIVVR